MVQITVNNEGTQKQPNLTVETSFNGGVTECLAELTVAIRDVCKKWAYQKGKKRHFFPV